jgi:hypothetical protein
MAGVTLTRRADARRPLPQAGEVKLLHLARNAGELLTFHLARNAGEVGERQLAG